MSDLRRTPLYGWHEAAGATLVDFGGWEMPLQYPTGIVEEHLSTRKKCGIFDVSHMGRYEIGGKDALAYLQHVLTSNVAALDINQAQYTILPDETGGAVDDAYVYRFQPDSYMLVVNASNADKDYAHLQAYLSGYDATITDRTQELALLAVQGPMSKDILTAMADVAQLTEPMKNALNTVSLNGKPVLVSKTGYTGEPIGYELFVRMEDAVDLWQAIVDAGATPVGLGARDTLRLEAGLPLYGDELGADIDGNELPLFTMPLSKFAVSFAEQKGNYVGRDLLKAQFDALSRITNRDFSDVAALPRLVRPFAVTGRGIARHGDAVYYQGEKVGYVTSGTMVPYYPTEGQGLDSSMGQEKALRAIGLALMDCRMIKGDAIQVEIRGKLVDALVVPYHMRSDAPPYARPILAGVQAPSVEVAQGDYHKKAMTLIGKTLDNHVWRQENCVNLIPSEQTPSRAVRLLYASDPAFRYAEHKKIKSFYDSDVFYYQGTKFIDEVEQQLIIEMTKFLGCANAETRVLSGQMANTAVFSALMDFKNRVNRKQNPRRLGYVLNNHIIKGGHLSAQPMGALHDYIAVDPVTERSAVVNFPVRKDNIYKIDVAKTRDVLEKYRPELIIFGKSMVLHKEPVAEIRKFVTDLGIQTTIMYDMAHVLGLIGDHFQKPFEEGAEIVTGSTHKTFFGAQRGVIGVNYRETDPKYELWETIQSRVFPGSVSNHHLGTLLGQLMAAYEMNRFKDDYQSAVIHNAKHFAKALKAQGLNVQGDPAIDYTETHQVLVKVGYGSGPETAERLEANNIIVNYQATPDEEGFTASGALRMGVSEMTRFGFDDAAFDELAALMGELILHNAPVGDKVAALRSRYAEMRYCFSDEETEKALDVLAKRTGIG